MSKTITLSRIGRQPSLAWINFGHQTHIGSDIREPAVIADPEPDALSVEVASIIANSGGSLFDLTDDSAVYAARTGSGPNSDADDLVGLVIDKAQTGGKSVARYMSDNAISVPLNVPGNHFIAPSDAARPHLRVGGEDRSLDYSASGSVLRAAISTPIGTSCTFFVATDTGIAFTHGHRVQKGPLQPTQLKVLRGWGVLGSRPAAPEMSAIAEYFGHSNYDEWDMLFANRDGGNVSLRCDTDSSPSWEIDWGDGTVDTPNSGTTQAHTFASTDPRLIKLRSAGAITRFDTSANTFAFATADLPPGLTRYVNYGTNTDSGDVADLPTSLDYYRNEGQNTVSGNLGDLPASLALYRHIGQNSVTGGMSAMPTSVTFFRLGGLNSVSVDQMPWNTVSLRYVRFDGALTTGEVDDLLISLAQTATWTSEKQVDLRSGGNAARSSASDAAVTTLQAKGVTVRTA